MKLRAYIGSLTSEQLQGYAERCNSTANYIGTHVRYATKEPSVKLMRALANESEGSVSMLEVLEHYGLIPHSDIAA